jgi:LmbE family N-acetylglucosaminyl deacetylase
MHAFYSLLALLTLGLTQIPRVKGIIRYLINQSISVLLWFRSRDYTPPTNKVTLFVAPHQDDSTLGCGGLLARKRIDGQTVHVVYVTDGSASHPGHPTLPPDTLATVRHNEGLAALRILGVETPAIHFLGARDGTLNHLSPQETSALVAGFHRLVLEISPDEVFIPYRRDGSSEHEAAFRLFLDALQSLSSRPRIFEYLVWSWWNPLRLLWPWLTARRVWRYRFRGYDDIKKSALKCYRSQFESTPPWNKPVMSPEFLRLFKRSYEFYFEI